MTTTKVCLLENVKGFEQVMDVILPVMKKNLPEHLGETNAQLI